MELRTKRAYEKPGDGDGRRVLVDRIWPRGVSREHARIDYWARDLAPSPELRKWFGHDPARWDDFRRRYFGELAARNVEFAALRRALAGASRATFVYGARDRMRNNAVALVEYLHERL